MKIIYITEPRGLKCDNPTCFYADEHITRQDYDLLIGYPCPICGQSLLTQADMNVLRRLERRVDRINFWFGWLSIFSPDLALIKIGKFCFDGSGKPEFTPASKE